MKRIKFYRAFTYSALCLIAFMLIYAVVVLLYKEVHLQKIQKLYAKNNQIALYFRKFNKEFLPVKFIPENKPVRILVLEGGGFDGIMSAKLLAYLEKSSGRRISDLFDVIGATSVGALQVAILTVPNQNNTPRYTAADLLQIFENNASLALQIKLQDVILSGGGIISPLIDTFNYNNLITKYIGDTQLSELTANVFLTGYNIESHEVMTFSSRQIKWSQQNFLMSQLIAAITSIPAVMPPQQISSLSGDSSKSYLISDPSVVINNPIMATILYANSLYPKNKKIVVFLGLGLDQKKHGGFHNYPFGFRSRLREYYNMRWAYDKLALSYLTDMSNLQVLGLSKDNLFYIDEVLDINTGSELDGSKNKIMAAESSADLIIKHHKSRFAELVNKLKE